MSDKNINNKVEDFTKSLSPTNYGVRARLERYGLLKFVHEWMKRFAKQTQTEELEFLNKELERQASDKLFMMNNYNELGAKMQKQIRELQSELSEKVKEVERLQSSLLDVTKEALRIKSELTEVKVKQMERSINDFNEGMNNAHKYKFDSNIYYTQTYGQPTEQPKSDPQDMGLIQ